MLKRILKRFKDLFSKVEHYEPPDLFDDPNYDVDHITEDDDTPRDELEEPEPEVVEEVFRKLPPAGIWDQRQELLLDAGFNPGPLDGKVGPRTQSAIRAFQSHAGLKVDGIWGPATDAAIRKTKPVAVRPVEDYEDMIGEVELGAAFFSCFVDLTHKSNVLDSKGRHRRKGRRSLKNVIRKVIHQTAFFWKTYRWLIANKKYSGHHKINAHITIDTDGTILLTHNFFYYLWTANAFNPDCISIEIMGNFEGVLGTGNWYKPEKFGYGRPERIQLIRYRQLTLWLLDPEQGPPDEALPKPMLEWRLHCRAHGCPLKYENPHSEATDDRILDCGSETFYHASRWCFEHTSLEHGPVAGKGVRVGPDWFARPSIAPKD